jgi:hypothetical protein
MTDDQRKWLYYAIPVAVVIAIGAGLYYWRTREAAQEEPVAEAPAQAPSAEPPIKHPIADEAPGEAPLPPLAESDAAVHESLSGLFGRSLEDVLAPKDIVRNVVVTIDNLPRKKTAVQRWPVKPTPGELAASGAEELTLSDANYKRYATAVSLVQNVDAQQLTAMYRRFYPLFQEAYVDLGYPEGYFNDRLVEVIDHLLATPEVQGPIRLTQPGVFYEFADRELEERSAGQKLLIRMGPTNAAAVKAKLRELRQAVAGQPRQ